MFSRRHPYLFFLLTSFAIGSGTMIVLTMLISYAATPKDYETFNQIAGDRVGVVEIIGVIADSKKVIRDIKKFREDDSVKAIVLRIDSPGGGVGPSQEIYREIMKTKEQNKIIIASMGSVAASGGYYAASATDGIMANPGTITGSIGVIMEYANFEEIFKKIGLDSVVIKSGKYKDMGSPVRPMTGKEQVILQDFVDNIHLQFVTHVAEGRNMDIESVKELADGRIYSGKEAKELGLVDELGNLEDAIEWAGHLGGIEGKVPAVYIKDDNLTILKEILGSSLQKAIRLAISPSLEPEAIYRN